MTLDDVTRRLVNGKNFATLATINPDGSPQTSVVWVGLHGDSVVFSSTAERQKVRNIARDPRVSLTVFDLANPYRSVEIRGTVDLVDDPGRVLPKRLSQKYLGTEPPEEGADVRRVIGRLTPRKVIGFTA